MNVLLLFAILIDKNYCAFPSRPFQPGLMFVGEDRSLPKCGADVKVGQH